jgi:hypothetical protein
MNKSNNAGVSKNAWTWPNTPSSQVEFEAMMASLDAHLAREDRIPAQRPFEAVRLLSMSLGYSGKPLLPVERIETSAPYDAGWCIKAAWEWFDKIYSDQSKMDFGPGSVVFRLRGAMWRLRMPKVYGRVDFFVDRNLENKGVTLSKTGIPPASVNVLCLTDGLSSELAARLSNDELGHIASVFQRGYWAMLRLESLSGDEFFVEARKEYRSSIDALMAPSWPQARRNTASCAELAFKGVLRKAGKKFPTSGKDGHDIPGLGQLVQDATGAAFNAASLAAAHCSTNVRYVRVPSTADDALAAHRSLLEILTALKP